jgi:hypothetical protein
MPWSFLYLHVRLRFHPCDDCLHAIDIRGMYDNNTHKQLLLFSQTWGSIGAKISVVKNPVGIGGASWKHGDRNIDVVSKATS